MYIWSIDSACNETNWGIPETWGGADDNNLLIIACQGYCNHIDFLFPFSLFWFFFPSLVPILPNRPNLNLLSPHLCSLLSAPPRIVLSCYLPFNY